MTWLWPILGALVGPIIGGLLAAPALLVGVPMLAVWAGWSRNRDCERRGWRDIGRF